MLMNTFADSLNRRHKVMLFLTLIAAGLSLVLGAGVAKAGGVALLGMALAWIFGSDSRIVHWLLFGVGIALIAGTASFDFFWWRLEWHGFENRPDGFFLLALANHLYFYGPGILLSVIGLGLIACIKPTL